MKARMRHTLLALLLGAACCGQAAAQSTTLSTTQAAPYPSRAIRMVVPFPPGGPNDIVGRTIGQKLQERWGQAVVIDNRPGASSVIGTEFVVKSPPDGYTLMVGGPSLALTRFLFSKAPYDVDRDLAPVILVAKIPNVLLVHPSVPARNVAELVALARAKPGVLNYGSTGTGTATHLFAALFERIAGVKLNHIPYKGTAPAVNDLLAGQIEILFDSLSTALPNLRAGKVRALGITNSTRSPSAPDIPTLAEEGVTGYEAVGWFGIVAPAKVPEPVIAALNAEIAQVIRLPDVQERLARLGGEPAAGSAADFGAYIRVEADRWGRVMREAGVKME